MIINNTRLFKLTQVNTIQKSVYPQIYLRYSNIFHFLMFHIMSVSRIRNH